MLQLTGHIFTRHLARHGLGQLANLDFHGIAYPSESGLSNDRDRLESVIGNAG
jgi:hypothetical protein